MSSTKYEMEKFTGVNNLSYKNQTFDNLWCVQNMDKVQRLVFMRGG